MSGLFPLFLATVVAAVNDLRSRFKGLALGPRLGFRVWSVGFRVWRLWFIAFGLESNTQGLPPRWSFPKTGIRFWRIIMN